MSNKAKESEASVMKKRTQDKEQRKLQLHKETLHNLLTVSGGDFSLTCVTCPDQQTGTNNCGACA